MQNCYSKRPTPALITEQNERLTAKHVKALSFLQELGNENKRLKLRVQDLECQVATCQQKHGDSDLNAARLTQLTSKLKTQEQAIREEVTNHFQAELTKALAERAEAEKCWLKEKLQITAKMETQRKQLEELLKQGDTSAEDMKAKMGNLQNKVIRQDETIAQLQDTTQSQMNEIEHLRKSVEQSERLGDALEQALQEKEELRRHVGRLEHDLHASGAPDRQEVGTLRSQLAALQRGTAEADRKSRQDESTIAELNIIIDELRVALATSEREGEGLRIRVDDLLQQLAALRSDSGGQTFRDFVQLKREVSSLRQENNLLKSRQHVGSRGGDGMGLLPSLDSNGKIHMKDLDHPRLTRGATTLSLLNRKRPDQHVTISKVA